MPLWIRMAYQAKKKMQQTKLDAENLVSSTGQFRWDTRLIWSRLRKEAEQNSVGKKTTGWDPYEVWQKRVRQD